MVALEARPRQATEPSSETNGLSKVDHHGASTEPARSPNSHSTHIEPNGHRSTNGHVKLVSEVSNGVLVQLTLPGELGNGHVNGRIPRSERLSFGHTNTTRVSAHTKKDVIVQIGYFQGGSRVVGNGTADAHTVEDVQKRIDGNLRVAIGTIQRGENRLEIRDENMRRVATDEVMIFSNVEGVLPHHSRLVVQNFSR